MLQLQTASEVWVGDWEDCNPQDPHPVGRMHPEDPVSQGFLNISKTTHELMGDSSHSNHSKYILNVFIIMALCLSFFLNQVLWQDEILFSR